MSCSSPLSVQHPAGDSPPEKDKEAAEKERPLSEETLNPPCGLENSSSSCVPQKLPIAEPLSCADPQRQTGGCEVSSPPPLSLLHFDRQARGRISISPMLRRLRGSGRRTLPSTPHQETLAMPSWGSCRLPADSLCYLSQSLPGSPRELTHSLSPPVELQSTQPLDPTRTFSITKSLMEPTEDGSLPECPPTEEGALPQICLPQREENSQPSPAPEPLSPQGDEPHQPRLFERRRSSVVLNLPSLEVFPGDLLVSDGAADYLCHHPLLQLNPESRKSRWPFSKRGMVSSRDKHISDLENCLSSVKITDFRGFEFYSLKNKTWNEVLETHQELPLDQADWRKQQEAVWELFTSECTYFLDHLLVLKMIFMNTLKHLQTQEHLLDVDSWRLFANLEELSQTSFGFASSLFSIIKDHVNRSEASPTMDFISVITKYFRGSLCQSHQTYCLNYSAAIFYLENLRQREDFGVYLKWCEQNAQCRRLHLPELLVAPLHRLTRYPLLLRNIWKRSADSTEKITIYSIKEKVEKSIRDLEGKVKWLDNYQKCRRLREIIVWPPLWDRDKRFFIPECLKHVFKDHTAENILSPTNRQLLYEGKLTLAESTRFLDVYLFLFDDFLLVTKTKRNKKLGGSDPGLLCPSFSPELQTVIKEGGSCTVLDQPIPVDRLVVRSIDPLHVSAFGLRHAFLIQHENRYRQCVAAFLLQAQTENIKTAWMAQLTAAISCFTKNQEMKKVSLSTLPTESSQI
ncbi:pleckstrin homology domain-containing family G member 7 isoform X3 [Erinaceus europaeus]|uniref:Pleckstrin homology domain-containing family G member 7 isoform X3 n=1 Tax=Erinaceus europaeus TaxID=9365 RepID=A0ABM3XRR4_ERIEU|nr:pleckstrin homology domain-containing family G member 7 isoform X3 [Erinaceus europaeus]